MRKIGRLLKLIEVALEEDDKTIDVINIFVCQTLKKISLHTLFDLLSSKRKLH